MEPIIIQAEPTAKEINQANFEHRCNTLIAGPVIVLFSLSIMAAMYGMISLNDTFDLNGTQAGVIFFIAISIPFILSFLYIRSEWKRDHTGGVKPTVIRYVFNDEGVQLIDEHGTSFIFWSDINNAYDCVLSLAFAVKFIVFVLPKRNFKNGDELKRTRQLMKDKIPKFTYGRGHRPDVIFENTYEKSGNIISSGDKKRMLAVEVSLDGPAAAKVILKCRYQPFELSEFQWRYVTKGVIMTRCRIYFIVYYLLARYCLSVYDLPFGIYDFFSGLAVAAGCLGYFQFEKARRFKTVPAFYGNRFRAVMEIGNDLVLVKTKGLQASVGWNEILEVHETTRFFILKSNVAILFIIPKRALNDEYKRTFVENLLRRKKTKETKDA